LQTGRAIRSTWQTHGGLPCCGMISMVRLYGVWRGNRTMPVRPGVSWCWPRFTAAAHARTRRGGVGVQIVRDWVLRFNAKGPDGLLNSKAPGAPQHSRRQPAPGVAAGGGGRPHPSRPWRRSLGAVDRSRAVAVRGVLPRDLQANAQPGTAEHGFSQALGAAAPSGIVTRNALALIFVHVQT
jgi:hypothetical protein